MEKVYLNKLVSPKPELDLTEREVNIMNSDTVDKRVKEQVHLKETVSALLKPDIHKLEKALTSIFKVFQGTMQLSTADFAVLFSGKNGVLVKTLLRLTGSSETKYEELSKLNQQDDMDFPLTIKALSSFIDKNRLIHENSTFYNMVVKDTVSLLKNAGAAMDETVRQNKAVGEMNKSFIKDALRYSIGLSIFAFQVLILLKPLFNNVNTQIWNESVLTALTLTKDVSVAIQLCSVAVDVKKEDKILLSDILPVHQDFVNLEIAKRVLEPGAYIIIGGPMTGKSLLIQSIFGRINSSERLREQAIRVNIFEPSSPGEESLVLWEEISIGLSLLLASSKRLIAVDSLRFLNAASPYPAKRMGINSGLEIYATQLNEICHRANKIGLFVLSTSDMSREVTDAYKALLVGSTQGIIIPGRIDPMMYEHCEAPIEISLRNGDRSYIHMRYETSEPLKSLTPKEMGMDENREFLQDTPDVYENILNLQ